jgi:predicted nucleic acid-binding protein
MLVVDTSVAARWVIGSTTPQLAEEMSVALTLLPCGLVAPDLLAAEFANAMLNKVRGKEIDRSQALEAIGVLPDIVDFLPTARFASRALEISLELTHPAYDCFFLAAAETLDTQLVTADRRLVNRCADTAYAPLVAALTSRTNWSE